MEIGIVVCANGLGHIRRVLSILDYILATSSNNFSSYNFTIFFPLRRLKYLRNWDSYITLNSNDRVKFKDFSYPSNYSITSLKEKYWNSISLKNFNSFDFLWSDNITQVLNVNCNVLLTGSFFWYEILEVLDNSKKHNTFVKEQRNLVFKKKPIMIGNEYFSTNDVRNLTSFHPVGFYRYNVFDYGHIDKKDILLSAGLGGESIQECEKAIEKIINRNLKPPRTLWLEPKVYKKHYPQWIKPATYTSEMFNSCFVSCIRPGIGTISDSLLGRNYIISFSDSPEMFHNSSILEKNSFGENSENPFKGYLRALEIFEDKITLDRTRIKTAHLRSDGVSGSAQIICDSILN